MCVCVRPSPASGCCTTHGGFRADMHLFKNVTTCQDQRDAMWRAQEQWLVSSGCGHRAEALNLSLSRLSIQILGSGSLSPVSRPLSHVCMRSCLSRSVFVSPICISGLHVDKRWLRFSLSSNTQSCSVSILIFFRSFLCGLSFSIVERSLYGSGPTWWHLKMQNSSSHILYVVVSSLFTQETSCAIT